jgi:hypothetical protein
VNGSDHDTVGLELPELLGEHLLGDGGQETEQLAVAPGALEQKEGDQQLPPPAEHSERDVDGAEIAALLLARRRGDAHGRPSAGSGSGSYQKVRTCQFDSYRV